MLDVDLITNHLRARMLNDTDGDWPWLSYHALIHHHDVPDADFLRSCMEEVEHNLAKVCPLVTRDVNEYLERVVKVVVFSWTCSLFSVETIPDGDLAHIYNVSPEDMRNLTQALDASRKTIQGAVLLKLVPRIARYSAEDKAGPSSKPGREHDAQRSSTQVTAQDNIENEPARGTGGDQSDLSGHVTPTASPKGKERLGRRPSTQWTPKPTRRKAEPKIPKQRAQLQKLVGSRIANTGSQPDTAHKRKYRVQAISKSALARVRTSAALLAHAAHPATRPYAGSRANLAPYWQGLLAPAPPNSPSGAVARAQADAFSRTGDMPRAAGDAHGGIEANRAGDLRSVPSTTGMVDAAGREMAKDPLGAAAAAAQEGDASLSVRADDGQQESEVEAVQEASAPLPLPPASRHSPEANLPTNTGSPNDPLPPRDDQPHPHRPQPPVDTRSSDLPASSPPTLPASPSQQTAASTTHLDIPSTQQQDARAATPISRSSSSDSVERRLALTDDEASPDAPSPASGSSGPAAALGPSPLSESGSAIGGDEPTKCIPSKRPTPDDAAQPVPSPSHTTVPSSPPPQAAPVPAANDDGMAQQKCPPITPFSYPFANPLIPLPPAAPQPTSRPPPAAPQPARRPPPRARAPPTSIPAPYTSVPRPLPPAPKPRPAPPAPAPAPPRVPDLLARLDSIGDVELRLRVWALDTALRFLANFERTFPSARPPPPPPPPASPAHAARFRPGATAYADARARDPDRGPGQGHDVRAWARQMRAALLNDVRGAERAVLEYLRVREAVGRGGAVLFERA